MNKWNEEFILQGPLFLPLLFLSVCVCVSVCDLLLFLFQLQLLLCINFIFLEHTLSSPLCKFTRKWPLTTTRLYFSPPYPDTNTHVHLCTTVCTCAHTHAHTTSQLLSSSSKSKYTSIGFQLFRLQSIDNLWPRDWHSMIIAHPQDLCRCERPQGTISRNKLCSTGHHIDNYLLQCVSMYVCLFIHL